MKKILIPTRLQAVAKNILEERGYAVVQDADTPMDELFRAHPDAEALIVRSERIGIEQLQMLPSLKAIVRAGAGYDTIDIKAARARKIDVLNTPGANANAVAEEVIGMMLAASRYFIAADASTRSGHWEKNRFTGTELTQKTVGVVGLGSIGQLVCKRLQGFEARLLGYDPFISSDRARELGVELVTLPELFERSHFVTLHVPGTPETRGMVGRDLLMRMQQGAVLVNCARANIIDEEALREAKLKRGILFCNDVYPEDKEGKKSVSDIADIMLPHLGASTLEAGINAARRAAEFLVDLWEKGITRYVVNLPVPPGLDAKYQELVFKLAKLAKAWLGEQPVRQIEASFYGDLEQYADWMISPIVHALDPSFDLLSNNHEALGYLRQKGMDYTVRSPDNAKAYGNSMTVDLFGGSHDLSRISIRGTLTEGAMMVSRMADFPGLYFVPQGHSLFFRYKDRPAVLAKITGILGEHQINIHDIRAPHNETADCSLAALKVDKPVPAEVVEKIKSAILADRAFYIAL